MTEKELLIDRWNKEFQITDRVLKAYPADKLDLRPSEKSRTAKELAWVMCADEMVMAEGLSGKLDFSKPSPPPPATMGELIAAYENVHTSNMKKLKRLTPVQMKRKVKFPVAPRTIADMAAKDLCWLTVFDHDHHRGQFSVYLRIAGGKLPSIDGPTADEPWN